MRLNQPFSVRLANGSQRAFATAEEMANWIQQQRSLEMPTRNSRRRRGQAHGHRQVNRVKRHAGSPNESPLDRFNRNSSANDGSAGSSELN